MERLMGILVSMRLGNLSGQREVDGSTEAKKSLVDQDAVTSAAFCRLRGHPSL